MLRATSSGESESMTVDSPARAGVELPKDSFTLDSYRVHLEATASLYDVVGYDVLGDPDLERRRFCLLRHDVDFSPTRALAVARLEAEMDIRSTYAVLLTGEYYNPLEAETRALFLEIAALGHEIGLHFDAGWHGIADEAALAPALDWEVGILSRILDGRPINMFAFHNTTPFTMGCLERRYSGLWNAYAGVLRTATEYTSDSNGYWIHRRWADLLEAAPERIHLLTHPDSWVEKEASPAERICSEIEERSRANWNRYATLLAVNGRENRSDIGEAFEILPARLGPAGAELVRRWLSGARREAVLSLYHQLLDREAVAPDAKRLYGERVQASSSDDVDGLRSLFTDLARLAGPGEAAGRP
jgi:hypothetical protein